jgi:hypothetical protein
MLNASLSHFLPDSDSIFQLLLLLFCGDFPFLGVRQILQLICSEEQLF